MLGSEWIEDDPPVDEWYDDREPPLEPWRADSSRAAQVVERRVSYVVLVDGRVVDEWHEPLHRSPWRDDPRVDRVQRLWREQPRPEPEPRRWVDTVRWLEHLVGGPDALAGLTSERLPDEEFRLPDGAVGDGDLVARFRRATTLLDELADTYFDPEMRTAFRRALASVGMEVLSGAHAIDPAQVAASLCWLVVKANGMMTPSGPVTQKAIVSHLGLPSFPTPKARILSRFLGAPRPPWVSRPYGLTELEAFSRTDLLTSRTRREIASLRDAALAAEARAAAHERAASGQLEVDLRDVS
jgi:hypothetical protein